MCLSNAFIWAEVSASDTNMFESWRQNLTIADGTYFHSRPLCSSSSCDFSRQLDHGKPAYNNSSNNSNDNNNDTDNNNNNDTDKRVVSRLVLLLTKAADPGQ